MSLKEMLPNRDAFGNYTVSKTYGGSCATYITVYIMIAQEPPPGSQK